MQSPDHVSRISSFLTDTFQEYRIGVVHSCFRTSFNFQLGNDLFHIGQEDRPLCCFGMVLSKEKIRKILERIKPGDLVRCRAGIIILYGTKEIFTINTNQMKRIDLQIKNIECALEAEKNKSCSERCLEKTLFWEILSELNLDGKIGIDKDEEFMRCCDWLEAGQSETMKNAVTWLIGRGIGLTPAGDDILLGYGAGVLALDPLGKGERFLRILSENLHDQTTDVSMAYYQALMQGYVNENMKLLLQELKNNDKEKIQLQMESVRAVGHTSGMDTLEGFRLAFTAQIKNEG